MFLFPLLLFVHDASFMLIKPLQWLPLHIHQMAKLKDTIYLCNFRVSTDGEWLCLKELNQVSNVNQMSLTKAAKNNDNDDNKDDNGDNKENKLGVKSKLVTCASDIYNIYSHMKWYI